MKRVFWALVLFGCATLAIVVMRLFASPLLAMVITIPSYGRIVYPIKVAVDVDPDSLNPESEGKWITVYIEPPSSYNVSEIDVSSIRLNDSIPVDDEASITVGDHDHDDIQDLMIKFDRAQVVDLLSRGETKLGITGEINEDPFEGSYTVNTG